jgi:UPF0716 protein FxsA
MPDWSLWMNRASLLALALISWLFAELFAFFAVAQAIGFSGALLVGLVTTLAGFVLLRQTGDGVLGSLRAAASGAPRANSGVADGLIRALAAVLLILPGFLSDLAGLALAAPSIRQILARRFRGATIHASPQRPRNPTVVDLAPNEWASSDQ